MTAKRESTMAQKVDRIYRRQIEMDRNLKTTMKTLADSFTRILRQNDTLRGENETLRGIIAANDRRAKDAADAFLAKPLDAVPAYVRLFGAPSRPGPSTAQQPSGEVPTLTDTELTAHVLLPGSKRCSRCGCLREAILASGTACEPEAI
jgi:hypothetical protein